jgi:hypothetical protein
MRRIDFEPFAQAGDIYAQTADCILVSGPQHHPEELAVRNNSTGVLGKVVQDPVFSRA